MKVGVIVGRFQVPELHDGHRYLIQFVDERSDRVLIVIGTPGSLPTAQDPLSFEARVEMISAEYHGMHFIPIKDHKFDEVWSRNLDKAITNYLPGIAPEDITLYGSRDSFLKSYNGKFTKYAVPSYTDYEGTSIRESLRTPLKSIGFRQGVIHAQVSRPPIVYPAVDIAVFNGTSVLLGIKSIDAGKFRFIGGFVDPTDTSYEDAALRELKEEALSIEVHSGDIKYVGSIHVDDWRYRGKSDGIVTTLFKVPHFFGGARAGDDLDGVIWVPVDRLLEVLVDEHLPLGRMYIASLGR